MTAPEPGPAAPPTPYRAEALAATERGGRLDELLPVTSPRMWLLALAAAILIGATLLYTAVTPRDVTVEVAGRVVGDGGIGLVTASAEGQMGPFALDMGTKVKVGQKVAEVITATGKVNQYSQVEGDMLGYLPSPGSPVSVGEWLAQITLKADDPKTALIIATPEDAGKITAGMTITGRADNGEELAGKITEERTPAFPPSIVQEGMGTLETPDGPRVVIKVLLDQPGPVGYEFRGTVMVSKRTLLQQLLGMG